METITVNQLAQLVKKMRLQQNEYFRYRTKSELVKSKKLEYEVDKVLKTIEAPENEINQDVSQQNLFL